MADDNQSKVYSNIPVPDPSIITTERIDKLRIELKGEIKLSFNAIKDNISTRLDSMDKAAIVLADSINHVPTLLDREIARTIGLTNEKFLAVSARFEERDVRFAQDHMRLDEIITEKFGFIALQFRERDIRTDQDKMAASVAVNAALQAQKEAAAAQNVSNAASIFKSENGFTKEIDGLKAIISSIHDGIGQQITDLSARLARSESIVIGRHEDVSEKRLNIGTTLGIIGAIGGALALLAAVTFGVMSAVNSNTNSAERNASSITALQHSAPVGR